MLYFNKIYKIQKEWNIMKRKKKIVPMLAIMMLLISSVSAFAASYDVVSTKYHYFSGGQKVVVSKARSNNYYVKTSAKINGATSSSKRVKGLATAIKYGPSNMTWYGKYTVYTSSTSGFVYSSSWGATSLSTGIDI